MSEPCPICGVQSCKLHRSEVRIADLERQLAEAKMEVSRLNWCQELAAGLEQERDRYKAQADEAIQRGVWAWNYYLEAISGIFAILPEELKLRDARTIRRELDARNRT